MNSANDVSRRDFLKLGAGTAALALPAVSIGASAHGLFERGGARSSFDLPATTEAITPFLVNVPEQEIRELRNRLKQTRWPDAGTVSDWRQGVPMEKAKRLVMHWANEHDWRKFERRINAFPQFRTRIDGLGIHFIHAKSKHANALPIILTHGWPGSVVEFLEVIERLTNPTAFGGTAEEAFDVVVPSQPGFGFSDKPTEQGWDVMRTAKAWATLMQRLGYTKWVAQGGDWGSGVTHALGHLKPQGLVAAHVNWPLVFPDKLPDNPTPEEKRAIEAAGKFSREESGYFLEQATKLQTIGYSLADSPVGQACWIYEKFQAWTDNHGNPEDALPIDAMLDNISLYWFTNTSASSARIYWQNSRNGPTGFSAGRIDLPMGATIFPKEIYRAPRAWAEAAWPNMFYWSEVEHGGHFAAFEQPQIFSEEMRKAFKVWR